MSKLVLIGGYPRGHERPFNPKTLSGIRLRGMVEELRLDARFIDLWISEQEERQGLAYIDPETLAILRRLQREGWILIALGKWVRRCLLKHGVVAEYLPHPAARRRIDHQQLREGLMRYAP